MSEVAAVAFDLDGVLIESEQTWDGARRANREFRPPASVLSAASVVLASLDALTAAVVESTLSPRGAHSSGDTRRDPPDAG